MYRARPSIGIGRRPFGLDCGLNHRRRANGRWIGIFGDNQAEPRGAEGCTEIAFGRHVERNIEHGRGMYGEDLYLRVRLAFRHEELSRREAARRFRIDRKTVAKMLTYSVSPGYRLSAEEPAATSQARSLYGRHRPDPRGGSGLSPRAAPHGEEDLRAPV